jgi:hypothetical protein
MKIDVKKLNVNHAVKLEQYGAVFASREGVICVTNNGTNILLGELTTER